jgi:hypothetical protein
MNISLILKIASLFQRILKIMVSYIEVFINNYLLRLPLNLYDREHNNNGRQSDENAVRDCEHVHGCIFHGICHQAQEICDDD